jgi:hypothetical protein
LCNLKPFVKKLIFQVLNRDACWKTMLPIEQNASPKLKLRRISGGLCPVALWQEKRRKGERNRRCSLSREDTLLLGSFATQGLVSSVSESDSIFIEFLMVKTRVDGSKK